VRLNLKQLFLLLAILLGDNHYFTHSILLCPRATVADCAASTLARLDKIATSARALSDHAASQ
jgi:hypothetical protein